MGDVYADYKNASDAYEEAVGRHEEAIEAEEIACSDRHAASSALDLRRTAFVDQVKRIAKDDYALDVLFVFDREGVAVRVCASRRSVKVHTDNLSEAAVRDALAELKRKVDEGAVAGQPAADQEWLVRLYRRLDEDLLLAREDTYEAAVEVARRIAKKERLSRHHVSLVRCAKTATWDSIGGWVTLAEIDKKEASERWAKRWAKWFNQKEANHGK